MRSESKHTPGPWRVCGGNTPHYKAVTSEKGYIVFCMADRIIDRENGQPIKAPGYDTQEANARLIAAAPELLAYAECAEAIECLFNKDKDGQLLEVLSSYGFTGHEDIDPLEALRTFLNGIRRAAIAKATPSPATTAAE